ncbi:hypothetical protein [Bacillus solimangrovi]|uniref:Uncharacterized protein n=1 Tax=Bacillus solimangrovi TaxID=1305675 RepID=A0A1E5LCP7_9BACI|nr:hypothetical protein [Bacillus solimangrovi]OEH91809.1 hypothetical protein BFG57_03465 [Bacillus solimangrovi]
MKKILLYVLSSLSLLIWSVVGVIIITERSGTNEVMLVKERVTAIEELEISERKLTMSNKDTQIGQIEDNIETDFEIGTKVITENLVSAYIHDGVVSIDKLMEVLEIE